MKTYWKLGYDRSGNSHDARGGTARIRDKHRHQCFYLEGWNACARGAPVIEYGLGLLGRIHPSALRWAIRGHLARTRQGRSVESSS